MNPFRRDSDEINNFNSERFKLNNIKNPKPVSPKQFPLFKVVPSISDRNSSVKSTSWDDKPNLVTKTTETVVKKRIMPSSFKNNNNALNTIENGMNKKKGIVTSRRVDQYVSSSAGFFNRLKSGNPVETLPSYSSTQHKLQKQGVSSASIRPMGTIQNILEVIPNHSLPKNPVYPAKTTTWVNPQNVIPAKKQMAEPIKVTKKAESGKTPQLSPEQTYVANLVVDQKQSIFFTGNAGMNDTY